MGLTAFTATQIPMNPIFAIHVGMGWPPDLRRAGCRSFRRRDGR